MKTKRILTRFGSRFGTLKFDETSSSNTFLRFTPFWYTKPKNANHADSPGVYTSDKILNLSTIVEFHLKCDVIDGYVVNGLWKSMLFTSVLDKFSGYKTFCEQKNIQICLEYYKILFRRWYSRRT